MLIFKLKTIETVSYHFYLFPPMVKLRIIQATLLWLEDVFLLTQ